MRPWGWRPTVCVGQGQCQPRRAVEAGAVVLRMTKKDVHNDASIENVGGAEHRVPCLVDFVQDDSVRPHLDHTDTALIWCACLPLVPNDASHGDSVLLLQCCDHGIVVGLCVMNEVKGVLVRVQVHGVR